MTHKFAAALMLASAFTLPVFAEDAEGFTIQGYAGVTTDYRDRGLSLSDQDPAVMASIGAYKDQGFYVGVSAATIDDQRGGDVRGKLFAGYRIDEGGDYVYDLSVELDSFHGDGSRFYPEFRGTVSRDFGLAFIRTGVNYAPSGRWSLPDNTSIYLFTDLEIPVPNLPELTIVSRLGYDMRSGGNVDLWDYGIGVSAFVQDFELSLMYENSSLNGGIGDGALVAGLKLYF